MTFMGRWNLKRFSCATVYAVFCIAPSDASAAGIPAWRFNNGEYPVREITETKLYTSRVACEVADECIQIHGGYGYMKEYGIERAYRDVRLNRIGAGTDEIMLEVIGRSYGL